MPRNTRIPNLSVNTAAPVSESNRSEITVSDTGSLRGDGISVSMAGMRIAGDGARPLCCACTHTRPYTQRTTLPFHPGGTPAAASSSEGGPSGEGGVEWLRSLEDVRMLGEGSSGFVKLVRHRTTPRRRYALKVVALGCAEQERKQILMELRTLHKYAAAAAPPPPRLPALTPTDPWPWPWPWALSLTPTPNPEPHAAIPAPTPPLTRACSDTPNIIALHDACTHTARNTA